MEWFSWQSPSAKQYLEFSASHKVLFRRLLALSLPRVVETDSERRDQHHHEDDVVRPMETVLHLCCGSVPFDPPGYEH